MTDKRGEGLDQVGEELLRAGLAWVDSLSRAAGALQDAMPSTGPTTKDDATEAQEDRRGDDGGADVADLLEAAARAQVAIAAAGFDFSRRLVDLQARRGPRVGGSIINAISDRRLSESDRRLLLDETRGYMREVADVTMQEAQNVTRALSEIDRRLAEKASNVPDPDAPHARRWRAKD